MSIVEKIKSFYQVQRLTGHEKSLAVEYDQRAQSHCPAVEIGLVFIGRQPQYLRAFFDDKHRVTRLSFLDGRDGAFFRKGSCCGQVQDFVPFFQFEI